MDGNLTLDHLSGGSRTLWGRLCGRVELAVPLQPLRGNLTYAALCTITRFEELIKGASSNRARKQTQKQRNKWFCSNLGLMFTSRSSRPLRPPTSTGSVYLSQFLLSVPPRLSPPPPPAARLPRLFRQTKLLPSKEFHRMLVESGRCYLQTDRCDGTAHITGFST